MRMEKISCTTPNPILSSLRLHHHDPNFRYPKTQRVILNPRQGILFREEVSCFGRFCKVGYLLLDKYPTCRCSLNQRDVTKLPGCADKEQVAREVRMVLLFSF